jgi:hypothetical protein
MKKRRLVQSQSNDNLINFMTQNKPFDINQVMAHHKILKQSMDQAVDQLHILTQLSKDNPNFKQYYHSLYESVNSLNNNIHIPNQG